MSRKDKILISGGHLTPAIATIQALVKQDCEVVLVGRAYTDIHRSRSKEEMAAEKLGISFKPIDAPKLSRVSLLTSLIDLFRLFPATWQAYQVFRSEKPNVYLSFGGYVALPLAIAAWLQRVPIVTHEQTCVVGLANRLVQRLSRVDAISWPETRATVKDSILIGNPVREAITRKQVQPAWFSPDKKPLIYVTGGNQGAQAINFQIFKDIEKLVDRYQIVHQTGDTREGEDIKKAQALRQSLPKRLQNDYIPKAWFEEAEVGWLIQKSDLVISRAGANTITELLIHHQPAILIPLPERVNAEQTVNAQLYSDIGLGLLLEQERIETLTEAIETSLKTKVILNSRIAQLRRTHLQAADHLAQLVIDQVNHDKCSANK